MSTQDTARAVLAKASAYDPMFRNPDPVILAAWTEALGDLDIAAALDVVTKHYQAETRSLMPADVLKVLRPRLPHYWRRASDVVAEIEARVEDDRDEQLAIDP